MMLPNNVDGLLYVGDVLFFASPVLVFNVPQHTSQSICIYKFHTVGLASRKWHLRTLTEPEFIQGYKSKGALNMNVSQSSSVCIFNKNAFLTKMKIIYYLLSVL